MSKDKYVQQTLELPSDVLFNYNISFEGLKRILEGVNIKTNQNEQQIKHIQEQLTNKLPTATMQQVEKKLNSSYLFGTKCQAYIDKVEAKTIKAHKTDPKDLGQLDQYCWKMNRMAQMVEYLMDKCEQHEDKLNNDKQRHEKLIEDSVRRLEDKLGSGTDSLSKTINSYFSQTNQKVASLDSQLNTLSKTHGSKIDDINVALSKRISEGNLKAALEAAENKIKKDLESMLKNDHMQRLSTVNELKQSFKETEKDIDLKNQSAAAKMQELTEKVAKALQTNTFQIEKHKIFERLAEIRNKTDDLMRRNNQFVEFRKNYLSNNEKVKQEMIGIQEEIRKMQNKEGSFKKLENMSQAISSLNPHLICQIGEEVKLHEKEIGKLQKMLLNLESESRNRSNDRTAPQVSGGQNSDLVQKIIKQYMANLDFEGRLKRSEKEVQQLRRKNDTFTQLQKKIYALSKQIDMGAIMKELKRKCDEENTRKDTRILDGKIEQLFQFYKQLRREVEERKKVVSKSDTFDNASLTTKRLLSANCISCSPSTSTKRPLNRSKMDISLDYSIEGHKNTIYSRLNK